MGSESGPPTASFSQDSVAFITDLRERSKFQVANPGSRFVMPVSESAEIECLAEHGIPFAGVK